MHPTPTPQTVRNQTPAAVCTANETYRYDQLFFGRSLEDWVQMAHCNNAKELGWAVSQPLRKGAYGMILWQCVSAML